MAVRAPQVPTQSITETRFHAVSFVGKLDTGELLTGTPTVTEIDTAHLTISNKAVNVAELTINGSTVAIGQAVQCKVVSSAMVAGTLYRILVTCTTTAGQVLNGEIRFRATD